MAATQTSPTGSVPEIPAGLTGNQLIQTINDRLRRLVALMAAGPAATSADLNMNGYRIVVLGDAVNPKDALNRESGDARYATQAQLTKAVAAAAQVTNVTTSSSSGSTGTGTLILSVPGTLAIESNAAQLVQFSSGVTWKTATALVKKAPAGAAITVQVSAGSAVLGTVTVADGAFSGAASVSWTLPANTLLIVDVVGVGLTYGGSDLTLELA
jgi:hypothetical protein